MKEPAVPAATGKDRLLVAIDGPSGSGKSTVARGAATRLGLCYLDTGAMYRALTWLALRSGVPLDPPAADTPEQLDRLAAGWTFEASTDPAAPRVLVNGTDVTAAVRTAEVTAAVSAVSAVPAVRVRLVDMQRRIAHDGCQGAGGVVVEGRDIGSVVLPDAPVKIFLTASGEARAVRRAVETARLPDETEIAATRADLERRDRLDSERAASPLVKVEDAVEIDTTAMGIDEVVDRIVELCLAATGDTAGPAARPPASVAGTRRDR